MPTAIRIWKVTTDGSLSSIPNTQINSEEQLETWLEQDISIISTDYMVIGRQVTTDFGEVIDLLCLDSSGVTRGRRSCGVLGLPAPAPLGLRGLGGVNRGCRLRGRV